MVGPILENPCGNLKEYPLPLSRLESELPNSNAPLASNSIVRRIIHRVNIPRALSAQAVSTNDTKANKQ